MMSYCVILEMIDKVWKSFFRNMITFKIQTNQCLDLLDRYTMRK